VQLFRDPVPLDVVGGLNGASSVGGLASALLSGTGLVAIAQLRMAQAAALASCGTGNGLGSDMGTLASPLGLALGPTRVAYQIGAIVGNAAIVATLAAALYVFAEARAHYATRAHLGAKYVPLSDAARAEGAAERAKRVLRTFRYRYRQQMRLPGTLAIPLLILVPGSAQAAMTAVVYGDDVGSVVVGAVGLLVFALCPVVVFWRIGRALNAGAARLESLVVPAATTGSGGGVAVGVSHDAASGNDGEVADGLMGDILAAADDPFDTTAPTSAGAAAAPQSLVRRALRYLLARRMAWRDAPPCRHNGTPRPPAAHGRRWLVRSYVRTVGMVFEDTAPPYFPLQDLAVAALGAVCAGVADGVVSFIPCVATISLSTAAALAHCVSVVRRRPALTRAQHAFLVVSNALAFSSVFLALLQYCGGLGDSYQAIADVLQSCQSVISIIMTLLTVGLCIQFVGESFRRMLRRQRHMHSGRFIRGPNMVFRPENVVERLWADDLLPGARTPSEPLLDLSPVRDASTLENGKTESGDDWLLLGASLVDIPAAAGADHDARLELDRFRRQYTRDAAGEELHRNLHVMLHGGESDVESISDIFLNTAHQDPLL
jgi:hypothetical protein